MAREFDPREEDFDAYACWEAGCCQIDEQCFGRLNDEDFEEVLFYSAPLDYACPLYEKRVEEDLRT